MNNRKFASAALGNGKKLIPHVSKMHKSTMIVFVQNFITSTTASGKLINKKIYSGIRSETGRIIL